MGEYGLQKTSPKQNTVSLSLCSHKELEWEIEVKMKHEFAELQASMFFVTFHNSM